MENTEPSFRGTWKFVLNKLVFHSHSLVKTDYFSFPHCQLPFRSILPGLVVFPSSFKAQTLNIFTLQPNWLWVKYAGCVESNSSSHFPDDIPDYAFRQPYILRNENDADLGWARCSDGRGGKKSRVGRRVPGYWPARSPVGQAALKPKHEAHLEKNKTSKCLMVQQPYWVWFLGDIWFFSSKYGLKHRDYFLCGVLCGGAASFINKLQDHLGVNMHGKIFKYSTYRKKGDVWATGCNEPFRIDAWFAVWLTDGRNKHAARIQRFGSKSLDGVHGMSVWEDVLPGSSGGHRCCMGM